MSVGGHAVRTAETALRRGAPCDTWSRRRTVGVRHHRHRLNLDQVFGTEQARDANERRWWSRPVTTT